MKKLEVPLSISVDLLETKIDIDLDEVQSCLSNNENVSFLIDQISSLENGVLEIEKERHEVQLYLVDSEEFMMASLSIGGEYISDVGIQDPEMNRILVDLVKGTAFYPS